MRFMAQGSARYMMSWARKRYELGLMGFGYPWEVRCPSTSSNPTEVSLTICQTRHCLAKHKRCCSTAFNERSRKLASILGCLWLRRVKQTAYIRSTGASSKSTSFHRNSQKRRTCFHKTLQILTANSQPLNLSQSITRLLIQRSVFLRHQRECMLHPFCAGRVGGPHMLVHQPLPDSCSHILSTSFKHKLKRVRGSFKCCCAGFMLSRMRHTSVAPFWGWCLFLSIADEKHGRRNRLPCCQL